VRVTRLDRAVAIKILPDALADDPAACSRDPAIGGPDG